MGVDQLVTGGDVNDPSVDSITTDDATINNSITDPSGTTVTGGALHLLRQAGYSSGDKLTLASFGATNASTSTSSSSFSFATALLDVRFTWDQVFPSGTTTYVQVGTNINPGTSETVTVRLFNDTDNEKVVDISGSSSGSISSGYTKYTPTTTNGTVRYNAKVKTEPANNSSTIEELTVLMGVEL